MPDPTREISRFEGKYQKDQGFAWDPKLRNRVSPDFGSRVRVPSLWNESQLAISAKSGSPIDQFAPSRMTRR